MPSALMTPGVYIKEKEHFSGSVMAVETSIPVFIGYTSKADRNGNSLLRRATKISSLIEYTECFGFGFKSRFKISKPADKDSGTITGKEEVLLLPFEKNQAYLYNSIRLFYANGGGTCYILPVGLYGDSVPFLIDSADFVASDKFPEDAFQILNKVPDITLVIIPDAAGMKKQAVYDAYQKVLTHCSQMQSRFAIFDLIQGKPGEITKDVVNDFREGIGTSFLNYGAAYYPWLKTSIVEPDEIDFENIDPEIKLEDILPENGIQKIATDYDKKRLHLEVLLQTLNIERLAFGEAQEGNSERINIKESEILAVVVDLKDLKNNYHRDLKALSPTYIEILNQIRNILNELPASGAIAGIYTMVDSSRGVWKSPSNVSLNSVISPSVAISELEQEDLNVDPLTGKSINAIREFSGIGTLVWGGRTLDGNSMDWRYINVRRTLLLIEQSIKLAVRAYVFEPNTADTWIIIKGMLSNFLTGLWKQGALAGAVADEAYNVRVGLGITMTAEDILENVIRISILVAVARPSEFIEITFQQQQS